MNKTDIANGALRALGVTYRIFDFDNETSNQAKIIREQFQRSLDTVTEATAWSFLNKTRDLPLVGDGSFGWLYEYSLPADCLTLRQIGTQDCFVREDIPKQFLPAWEFNNSSARIFCNVESAYGKYTRRVMESEDVPNYFGLAVQGQLAIDIAPGLILDKFAALKNTLESTLERDINRAIAYDSGRSPNYEQQHSSYELLLR